MKKFLFTLIVFAALQAGAQVKMGDNPTSVGTSSLLELESTSKALVVTRVANTAAVTNPVNGMIIYDISSNCFKGYKNGEWSNCNFAAGPISASNSVLAQIGTDADTPGAASPAVTIAQLNQILPALTGVTAGNITQYQAYIDSNPALFSAPATVAEVNAMINAVNASQSVLAQIGSEGDAPNTVPSVVTVAQINTISPAITAALVANQAAYQAYIDANPALFSAPATVAEVNAMINAVNASQSVLAQIGTDADTPGAASPAVTIAQLNQILPSLTGVTAGNITQYQAYIDANPALFSAPATVAEVNAMINAVNASQSVLAQIGSEGDAPNTVPSVVTVAQINTISPAITAALVANQAAYQAYIDANPALFDAPATAAQVQAMINAVNTPSVTSSTGKIWMDRNLGASQVATSSANAASYGDLYQWGRGTDGHQLRTSGTTTTLSSTDVPGNANFILINSGNKDWRSPQNNSLWQGVSGTNNPCPAGYRLPTDPELNAEMFSFSTNNAAGAFASVLKLPMAGYRINSNGSLSGVGSSGNYWSSTVSSTDARYLTFINSAAAMSAEKRAHGYSVRCIKD